MTNGPTIRRRSWIRWLTATLVIVAIDIAILRAIWDDSWTPIIAMAVLPTLDLLVLVAPRVWRPGPRRPFWAGFLGGGGLATLSFVLAARDQDRAVFLPSLLVTDWLERLNHGRLDRLSLVGAEIIVHATLCTVPLVLVAWAVGGLTQRYRIRVERRPR